MYGPERVRRDDLAQRWRKTSSTSHHPNEREFTALFGHMRLTSRKSTREKNNAHLQTHAVNKKYLSHAVHKMEHQCNHELRS